jgi:hypothetical protein
VSGILILVIALLLQAPVPAPPMKVVVMTGGQQVVIESPEFTGFIQGRSADAVLIYRQQTVHGRMPVGLIAKIELGEYRKGRPVAMTVTLKDGQSLKLESYQQEFLILRGKTELGTITIKHPDPVSAPLRLSSKPSDRKRDLTIQYLEFPAS